MDYYLDTTQTLKLEQWPKFTILLNIFLLSYPQSTPSDDNSSMWHACVDVSVQWNRFPMEVTRKRSRQLQNFIVWIADITLSQFAGKRLRLIWFAFVCINSMIRRSTHYYSGCYLPLKQQHRLSILRIWNCGRKFSKFVRFFPLWRLCGSNRIGWNRKRGLEV